MAGNLKQRLIKAGRDFNYAEGVKVLNNDTVNAIAAGIIVRAVGYEGPFLKVAPIFPTATGQALEATGRLLIMKHDLPAGGYGVGLPWKLVSGIDMSGKNVGEPVYGAKDGAVVNSGPGTKPRVVGHIVDNSATTGAYLFSGDLIDQTA